MAMSTTHNKKPLLLPFVAILMLLFLIKRVNSQEEISFLFDGFTKGDPDLIFQGDATVSSKKELQLTKVNNNGAPLGDSVGRVLYSEPIRLYDKSTGSVSNIFSSFIFLTSAPSSSTPADGLTFFLASPDTTIPPRSGGAFLGLFSADRALNNSRHELVGFKKSSDQVVAIEFDTYVNLNIGDPDFRHIGVDVNSIRSEVTAEWEWKNGQQVAVTIFYEPIRKNLRVYASYPGGSHVQFTFELDLTTVLPEYVRVGFSASTGLYSQVNNIISWSFSSILANNNDVVDHGRIASVV